ncbi:alpha-mannosidase 2 [Phymastichus coffea]|uniref:alpha-mannosidase 2 n=1 Tax=Phymastichus coffea TaxID=108790 RepID=UPI00273B466F|nr:alpha-mannosidase 2 [Phymastichus coffea]
MKARKLFAVLGAGLILACCVMIYLMLDVTLFPQRDTKSDVKYNQWLHFESRLAKLEEDLNRHHKAVNALHAAAQKIVEVPPDDKNINVNPFIDLRAEKPAVCTVNFRQIPEVDIQMLEIYKQLKFDNPDGGVWKQGWNIKYDEKQWHPSRKLKIFVVPHSHNDPGWLNTFEKYYAYQTQGILNNLVNKLSEDRRRKFIWAEISFFKLWWDEQTQSTRDVVKRLVHDGQLEIVAGGYVMPDESVSHWVAQLTQLTEGHQWLKTNLDFVPNTGWAIDPFGLSPTMPYLLKNAGLENIVIQRVHYSVKKKLAQDKHLEFRWRQLWDNDGSSEIFTHMMPFYSYDIPHTCGPDPKVCCQFDFYRLPSFGFTCPWKIPPKAITKSNVGERAAMLLDQYRKKAQLFKSNVVLIPLGDDFRYSHVTEWDAQFTNYQKLFDYMNNDRQMNVEIQFGTLNDYFEALRSQRSTDDYPSLSGDFFTYSDRDDHYWSGYYTSRPFHKRLDRVLIGALRNSELLSTIAWMRGNDHIIEDKMATRLDIARRWHSIFQHHDGVTGTARDHVVIDYAQKMLTALNDSAHVLQQSVVHLLKSPQKTPVDLEEMYLSLDETRSHHTSPGDKYVISLSDDITSRKVLFYNSLPRSRTKVASIYVSSPYVRVTDKMGRALQCQISPVWVSPGAISGARYELSFLVTVPAFAIVTYIVHTLHGTSFPEEVHLANVVVYNTPYPLSAVPGFSNVQTHPFMQEFSISQRAELSVVFGKTGLLKALRVNNTTYPVHLEFVKYGTRGAGQDKSGAYLFLPDKSEPDPVLAGNNKIVHLVTGPILSRVFTDLPYVKHICTLYNSTGSDGLGLHIMNEVDITETQNFELAMRIGTDIASGEVFYTDLNGLNMIKRQRFSKIPTQGNYYPLAAAGYIEDNRVRMSILTGQPLGATSMSSGQFEIMQDRRLMQDDNRGLSQGVTDNLLTYHQFTLLFEKRQELCTHPIPPADHPSGLLSLAGHLALDDLLHPVVALHPRSMPQFEMNPTFSPLSTSLPVDLSVVNLRVIPIPDGAGKGVAMVLHRQGLNLCWGDPELQQRFPVSKTGEVDLSKFLDSMQDWTISDAPLTFTNVGPSRRSPIVNLCPHQLLSLLFHKTES